MSDNMAYQQAYSKRYDGPFLNDAEQPVACNHFPGRRTDDDFSNLVTALLRVPGVSIRGHTKTSSVCAKVTMTIGVVALVIVALAIVVYLAKNRK